MLAGALTASVLHFLFKTLRGFKLALNQGRHREKRLSKYMAHRYIDVSMYLYIRIVSMHVYTDVCVCVFIYIDVVMYVGVSALMFFMCAIHVCLYSCLILAFI